MSSVGPVPYLPQGESAPRRPLPVFVGIDPGASGGIAWIERGRIKCLPMPGNRAEMWKWFAQWREMTTVRVLAVVELVGGYVRGAEDEGDHGGAANGARMFQFGRQYGEVLMALCAAGIIHKDVAPAVWQSRISLKKMRGERRADHKRRMVAEARRLYPALHVTSATADAVLICTYLYKVGFSNV